jgi:flagellar hook assembly protein FlgD/fibronectin type 3 domain-containing protein
VEGTKVTILEDPWMPFSPGTYFNPVEISPGGKYLDFESSRESHDQTTACWKGSFTTDRWVVASLLNLTTQFTFQRDGSQVVILGTAVDLNFREFHLEYAPVSSPDAWAPIGDPSDTPVINGELARWIPPSEGTYYVRLTASDKAGNQRSIIRRITWGLSPTITNVLISPRVFSGNGDGRSDAVTINYTVLGPVHLEFRIYDAQETLVKTIIQDHAVIGPASIAWDGRDEGGQFVADGIYRIDVLDYTFFVTMDTSLPDIGMAVGGAFRTVPNKIHCQQTLQGQVCSLLPGPLVETPHHLLTGHVSDAHLASWRLEVGQGVNPPEWGLVAEGTDLLVGRDSGGAPKTPIEDVILQRFDQAGDVVGKKFRLTAEDEAGNLRTLVTEFAPQEVILHAWDQLPVPTTLVIEQQPGPHALSIVQTVRTPLQALTVQYRLKGSVLWNDGPALSLPSASVELSWDTGSLAAGRTYDVRVVGRDFDGNEFVSNAIVIHSEVFVMTSLDQSRGISYGTASLRETLTDIRLVAAAPGEEEMGVGPAAFSTPTDFSIPINVARLCQARVSAIPLRYKGVGQSGKVYYSNAVTFVPPCQGEPGGSGTPTSRLLLKVLTDPAPDCGLPTPGRVTIELSGIGLEPGSEKLFIQDLPNGILKEAQGVTLPVVLQLDTKGRPEGTYAVKATARAFGADPTTEETTAVGSFIVDRTPPTGRITYPGPNQAFCPVKSGIRVVVPIEGIVEDPNLDHYELEYGLGDNPGKWVRFFPAAGDEAASRTPKQGILANWDVTDLSSGTYSLRLKVFDKGGNVVCHTVSFSLERGTRIQSLTADRRIFSPSGSGVPGSVLLSYAIEKNALIDAKVYPVQGGQAGPTAVRTILAKAQQLAGTNSFLWDGLTDAGAPAADGLYAVVVTATDACGNTAQASVQVEVDNTPPEAVITFPQATDALGRVVDVRGSTGDPHFDRATVEVGETHAPVTWSLLATLVAPVQNGLLAKWNTGGKAGPSTLRLTAKDTAGNQRQALVLLTVPQLPPLVSDLSATPILISPNRDGKLDTASISYGLGANSQVLLEVVDGWGTAVRTLASAGGVAPGSYAALWDGTNGAGVRVPDGEYTIRITATATADPTQTQTERTAVKVDATPPAAAVDTPADQAHVKGDVAVIGTAADANLESYSVTLTPQGGGAPVILDQGNQSRTGFAFGAIKGLADGTYILKVSATDLAQNGTEKTITLTLDNTGPKVTLTAPADGVLVGGAKGSVAVKGSVIEANLREWTLRFGSGPDPQSWTTITTQTTLPTAEVLATWEVGSLADGPYSLSLLVADKAGSVAEARLSIVVDNTPPAALLTQPTEGARIAAPIEIRGDAADAHLKSAILELSEGDAATAFKYVTLATLNTPVKGGSLFSWRALPPDGTYALRLSVEDEVGLRSVTKRTVKVDTQPPEPPTGLTAQAEDRRNARLTWTASPEKELAGYHVYRDGKKITSAIVTGTSYLDGNLTDGSYRYQVTAVDLALLESVPTNEARAQIDLTPPTTRLQAPVNGAVVGGLVDIRGSATGDDLKEYRILVRDESAATAWNLIRRSPAPVSSGPLAQWETLGLPEGGLFTIRLETEDLSGNQGSDQAAVRIDNAPPKAPVLLSATPGGSEISVQWMANTESDLAGYLLFSNDLLANVDRIVTGSFTPYLLSGTMFADRGLPDGTYKYTAYAVDKAGNISDPSNTVTAIVETGAPRATIIQPATGSKTEKPILLVATTADQDVVRVQFQVKAAADSTWTDLGGPVTGRPYQVTWDPNGLAYGSYNFRAVATDSNGKTDPSPTPMTIIHQDVTPPGPPGGLEVKVIEGTAALNWSANMEADLAGYHVYRRDDQGSPVKVTATPVMGTAFADPNLADGLYTYTVTAVDSTGNESDPSDPVAGQVYTPLAAVPNACLAASTTALSGSGVAPSSTVTLFVDIGQGPAASGSVQAAADGTFQFSAVPLVAGKNTLSVQATDPTGNASKKSAPLDVQYSPLPPAPSGLAALVNGFEVSLAWDAPTGPVVGYNLYRNGAPLNQIVDATSGGVPGASSFLYFSYYPPSDAVDGNPDTFWIPHFEGDPTPWWQLDFGTPILVKEVQINWYGSPPYVYGGRDFEVQRWDGSTWVAVQAFRDNDAARNVVTLANPVLTSRVRILITRSIFDLPYLTEVRVLKKDFIPGTDFTDSDLPNGKYTYTLKALNLCGVEGPAAEVTAAVGDVIPPAPVLNLTASVNGSDVTLQWTGGSDADLAGYNLYRNDGDGAWKKINTSPIPGTNFLDALVPNGSHAYRVTAQDATGNEGDPSNEAVAVVNVSAPPAPIQLVVEVRPEGGSLDISWGSGDPTKPIAGYRLFRGLTGGGPYAQLNQALITATTYRDAGLTNGVTYYYVVKAVDPANNESNPSNEGSGIPTDTVTPGPPVIQYPTDAAQPMTVTSSLTRVAGTSEPGTVVTLLREGIGVGTTAALSAPATESFSLDSYPESSIACYGPGSLLAGFWTSTGGTQNVLAITDVMTRQTRYYAAAIEGSSPAFSPDGTKIAYTAYDNGYRLYLFDRVAGAIVLTIALPDYASEFAFSPSGTQIALNMNGQLWILDLPTGGMTQLTTDGYALSSPVWSPDGQKIVYVFTPDFSTASLRLIDVTSKSVTDLDTNPVIEPPVFSPDGKSLAFASFRRGRAELWIHEMAAGAATQIPPGSGSRISPVFSPDGTALAYLELNPNTDTYGLHVRRLATGEAVVVAENGYDRRPCWISDGTLVQQDGETVARVRPAGHFLFDNVHLEVGENILSAVAGDTSGNISRPSEAIVLTLEATGRTDLAVGETDFFVYPLYPAPGETVRMSATVRNPSAVPATGIEVIFFATDTDGTISPIGSAQTLVGMDPGEEVTVSTDWQTTGLTGRHTLIVSVDPFNRIEETSEANNTARKTVLITAGGTPVLSMATNGSSFAPAGIVQVSVEATNPGPAGDFVLDLLIEDSQGFEVASLFKQPLPGFGQTSRTFSASWSATGTLAGAYRARAILTRASGEQYDATAPFTIEADRRAVITVGTDRVSYPSGEPVRIIGRVENTSPNAELTDLSTLTQVLDGTGAERFRETGALGTLFRRTQVEMPSRWSAGTPGNYTVRFTVESAGTEMGTASAAFSVTGVARLEGQLRVSPGVVPIGAGFAFAATAANTGTLDTGPVTLRLVLIDPDSQTILRSFERVVDLPAGGAIPWEVSGSSIGLAPKTYTISLQAQVLSLQILAAGILSVVDGQAPTVQILSPAPGTYHNRDVSVMAVATDDASGVDRVEIQITGGPWTQMTPADLAAGRYALLYPALPASEGTRTLTVRASDKAGNSADTSSSDPNPVSVSFVVDITPPQLAVSGITDGAVVNGDVVPGIQITDVNLADSTVLLDGAPYISGTPLSVEKNYLLEIRARDLAGNVSDLTIQFTIDKTAPDITITGVEDGGTYRTAVIPIITIAETGAFTSSIQLNGAPFSSGTGIVENGQYTLEVVATDQAGNTTRRVVRFAVARNRAPVANAGSDQTVNEGHTISLDGSGSFDPDGAPLIFAWTQTAGPPVQLSDPAGAKPTFAAPAVTADTILAFQVTVTDSQAAGDSATVNITVKDVNNPPLANAGADRNVVVEQPVTLDGTASYDPDGDLITYRWIVVSVPVGSLVTNASLSDLTSAKPILTPDVPGPYTLGLVVNDGQVDSEKDEVIILAELPPNIPPNADAGPDQQVFTGSLVILNGSRSNDPNNGPQPLIYEWSFVRVPDGSFLTDNSIAGRVSVEATFIPDVGGEYVVNLTVFDGQNNGSDQVSVFASVNTPPVADAGPDITIARGQTVILNGSGSSDPDSRPGPLTYLWRLVSRPALSRLTDADIRDAGTVTPSFLPDVGGVYVLSLTVSDGLASSTDNVAVTVETTERAFGGAYFLHDGYQEKLSLDVLALNGTVQVTSWLKYFYTKTRTNLVSTQILSLSVVGTTATITGVATMNGANGYRFTATVSDAAPDRFGIVIYRQDGTVWYDEPPQAIVGGDLIIQQQ